MYKFTKIIDLNWDEAYEDWEFGISMQSNVKFELLDCYFEFYRGNNGHEEESLIINYFDKCNDRKNAYKKIELSLKILTYLFLIPLYDEGALDVEEVDHIPLTIDKKSNIKVSKIESLSQKIKKLKKTKALFEDSMHIINAGIRFHYMSYFEEDAFLNFFKVIEKIVKYDNAMKRNQIEKQLSSASNKNELQMFLDKYLCNKLEVKFTNNKLVDLTDKLAAMLLRDCTQDVYSQIAFFCKHNNISINPNLLSSCIKVRNGIAHGDVIDMDKYRQEYSYIFQLALNIVSKSFFSEQYKNIAIKCSTRC